MYFFPLLFILFTFLTNAYAAPLRPDVIHISKAQYLNADGKLMADITKQVSAKDNVWAAIHNEEYVRVTFEQPLDRNYDNSIFARPSNSNKPATIEVYPVYTDKNGNHVEFRRIAVFSTINHDGFYKILLKNLQVPTNTFDFKITGNVDIDYIVDPAYSLLKSFGSNNFGSSPGQQLIVSGNTLYGMDSAGGPDNDGLIFSVGTDGSNFTILHNFIGDTTDGAGPSGTLTLVGTTLYGMTVYGGADGQGIVFSMATDGSNFQDLHDFSGSSTDGSGPYANVTISGSTMYGIASSGGLYGDGIIFSMATNGSNFQDLHDFSGSTTDGFSPNFNLVLSLGTLYGMALGGGLYNDGMIFSLATDGSNFQDLHDFSGSSTDGATPVADVILSSGVLYGMTSAGGADDDGIVFSVNINGTNFQDLHDFSGSSTDGSGPTGNLTLVGSNTLYGMAFSGGANGDGIIFSIVTDGTGFTDLYDFSGSTTDGADPYGNFILSGNALYGMTGKGGATNNGIIFSIPLSTTFYGMTTDGGSASAGSVFSIATGGAPILTDLHDFGGTSTDGSFPYDTLLISGGVIYGTTAIGGAYGPIRGPFFSGGTIFSIKSDGSDFTLLHSFGATGTDGQVPFSSLIISGSTLYGVTSVGGANSDGIIYSIGTDGSNYTDLHDFSSSTNDGEDPDGALVISGSTLYGTAGQGGANGAGIIFSIATNGSSFLDMHDFDPSSSTDGAGPNGSLVLSSGTLYGMTSYGGANSDGIIFSFPASGGSLTDLHDFSGSSTDGANPYGSLLLSSGILYGMTSNGGANSDGIIFSIASTGGTLTDMHDFSGSSTDGATPEGSLTLSGGTLYGMTEYGGADGYGLIFSIPEGGGSLIDLHDFIGNPTDGRWPQGSLTLSGSNNLYGMTQVGGSEGSGVIFLYSFTASPLSSSGLYFGTDF